MKKSTSILLLVTLFASNLLAQGSLPRDLQGLVEAERAFARLSVERGVRESFLTYFADDGVAFLPNLINAKKAYGSLPVLTGKPEATLNWTPVFGDISAAGDLGYSTGPVVRSDNTAENRPVRHSLYFSIWKKQANGEWRVVLDLGVGQLDRAYAPLDSAFQRAPQTKARIPKGEDHVASLLRAEREFLKSGDWRRFLRPDARVCRKGKMPESGRDWLAKPAVPMTGEMLKVDVARSGDMGYSYGTYKLKGGEKGNYARVWKRDATGKWRIVFDLAIALPDEPRPDQTDSVRRLLDYDKRAPLGISETAAFDRKGVRVHDITFASPKGGRVTAYLVVPKTKGPHAGMVFGHWGNGNRTEFLPEAIGLARAGAVSVLIDYPWERTSPWWLDLPGITEPEKRNGVYIQAIIDLRRAIDLLLSRADVDPKRIAYVGHSYGAQWGAILAAVDKRMKTAVLMAGVPSAASLWIESAGDAGFVEYRNSLPKDKLQKFVEVYGQLDAVKFAPYAAPVSLFFQFARQERVMTEEHMRKYYEAASEPKQVRWYDAGHELQDTRAIIDRENWLRSQLRLSP